MVAVVLTKSNSINNATCIQLQENSLTKEIVGHPHRLAFGPEIPLS